jgi:hypothetical protein
LASEVQATPSPGRKSFLVLFFKKEQLRCLPWRIWGSAQRIAIRAANGSAGLHRINPRGRNGAQHKRRNQYNAFQLPIPSGTLSANAPDR